MAAGVGSTRQGEEAHRHPIREDPVLPWRGQGLRGLVIRLQEGDEGRERDDPRDPRDRPGRRVEIGGDGLAEQFSEEDVQGHSPEICNVLCQYVCGRRSPAACPDGGRWKGFELGPSCTGSAPEDNGEDHPDGGPGHEPTEGQRAAGCRVTKDTVKVGIVVPNMLQAGQGHVYQSIGDKLDNGEVTAKIQSVLSNKVAKMEGLTPMDVGKIDNECESENLEDEVAAVSWSTQCVGCGGWDNLRRECPSVAKDGKGSKALGKGPGGRSTGKGLSTKGGQKGDGRGTKGSGKGGFKGSCFLFDQQEHRAHECQTHSANVEEEDEEAVRRSLDGRGVDEWPTKGVNANQGVEVRDRFGRNGQGLEDDQCDRIQRGGSGSHWRLPPG